MGRTLARIVIGLSATVFVVAGIFLAVSDFDGDEPESQTFDLTATSTDSEGDENEREDQTGSRSTTSVDAEVFDEESAQESCVNEKQAEIDGQDYEEGTLLVAFESGIEFSDASRIIGVEGASLDDEGGAEEVFEEYRWLEISFEEGEEALYICRFERYPEVRSARLNVTFNLHE